MMSNLIVIFVFALLGLSFGQDCVWDKDTEWPYDYEPLVVDMATWVTMKPVMEGTSRVIRITERDDVLVACPGELILSLQVESAEATCIGALLDIGGTSYDIMDLNCDARVDDFARADLGKCGKDNVGNYSSIGFDIIGYPFLEHIKVCFEGYINDRSLFESHILYAESVEAGDDNPSSPSFKVGDGFYDGYNPNDCYLTDNQDAYFTQLTGDPDYIDLNSNTYFSRGHLGPNADFLIEAEADASYYYINAMPQWQEYNGANWMYAEGAIRRLANYTQNNMQIYTGPHEKLSILDSNGVEEELYLCASQGFDKIPIAKYIWKVVYENATDLGLAIITSNIPYQVQVHPPVCTDLNCETIDWLHDNLWYPYDLENGYTICCTVQDWYDKQPNAPNLPTAGILNYTVPG